MKKEDKIILLATLILSLIIMEMIIFGGLGIGMVIGVISYFGCFIVVMRIYDKKMSKSSKILLIPIFLCTLCFVLFSNAFLKILNTLFLIGLLLMHGIEVWGVGDIKLFGVDWGKQTIKLGVNLPFCYFNKPLGLIKGEMSSKDQTYFKSIQKILIGILLALPILIIVLCLLENADAAFAGVIEVVCNNIHFEVGPIIKRVIVIMLLFGALFSYFYGLVNPKEKEQTNEKLSIRLDFIIIATVGTMLCLVYIVFYLSQLAYFISAFQGVLPEGFTFAEYARRGFFENLPLTMINLGAIWIFSKVIKNEIGKQRTYMKGMSSFIAIFTLFMSICALSKMWLYIQNYGLTLLRVYVTWFLVLSSLIVILIFINNIGHKVPLTKSIFITFTVMYLGLNYMNVDYIVAKQNAVLYEKGYIQDVSAYYNLSSSAMGPINQIAKERKNVLKDSGAKHIINQVRDTSIHQKWQAWNVADYIAIKKLDMLKNKK